MALNLLSLLYIQKIMIYAVSVIFIEGPQSILAVDLFLTSLGFGMLSKEKINKKLKNSVKIDLKQISLIMTILYITKPSFLILMFSKDIFQT